MNKRHTTDITDSRLPTHGGDLLTASRLSGIHPQDILDFSVSVNPLGLPECVAPLMEEIISDLGRYPDSESSELKHALADMLKVDTGHITVTNGSTELIYLLPRLWEKGKSVLCVTPCFSEYERSFTLAGIAVHDYALSPEENFTIEIDAFLNTVRGINNLGGIVIGHPNNPTGTLWNNDFLLELLAYCEANEIYLVIDETFIEFPGLEHSLAPKVAQSRFLILVQSLTKFYALAGLRVGHGITSTALAERIRAVRPPWSVSVPAQTIGVAVLRDVEHKIKTRQFIKTESQYLYERLCKIKPIEVFPSQTNFHLFHLRNPDTSRATEIYLKLLRDGILTRNCANFRGLNASFFRIAVKTRADNEILLSKLNKHFISS